MLRKTYAQRLRQASSEQAHADAVSCIDRSSNSDGVEHVYSLDTERIAGYAVALEAGAEARHQELLDVLDPSALEACSKRALVVAEQLEAALKSARADAAEIATITATARELSASAGMAPILSALRQLAADNRALTDENARMRDAVADTLKQLTDDGVRTRAALAQLQHGGCACSIQ